MKKIIIFSIVILVLITGLYFLLQKTENKGEGIRIIFHDDKEARLDDLDSAVKLGVYGVELDLSFTKDKKVVVVDPVITTASGKITASDFTAEELNKIPGIQAPLLDDVLELAKGKLKMLIMDNLDPIGDMTRAESFKIWEDIISKHHAEDFAVIQIGVHPEFLQYIDMTKYKVTFNTFPPFQVCQDCHVPFYTPNPIGTIVEPYVSADEVAKFRAVGAEPISLCVKYSTAEAETPCYKPTIQAGAKYIMVDYVENFKTWAKENNIKVYGE